MVAVRTSETLNSRNADDASSNTSGKARTTTAQHQPLADAEPPGVQATTPGDQEGRPSDLRARANELTENDEDPSMQKGPKRTEFHSVELDASTVVQNRAPMRTIGDAAQTMVQSIASATKMAKQSLWGPPPLLWQAEEAAEGDEMLVRKLEEQLNAVKQRLSLAGSTTSGGSAEGRIPSTQRRASIGASEDEHAGAEQAIQAQEISTMGRASSMNSPPPPPDDGEAEWLREKTQRDIQRELNRVQRERDEQAAHIARMEHEHRLQMELAMQQASAQLREHILEQKMLTMQAELRLMQARSDDFHAARASAERDEEKRREESEMRRLERADEWKVKELYSEQLTRCPIDKAASFLETWMIGLAAASTGVCPEAAELINHVISSDGTMFTRMGDPKYAKADMWLARQIIGCVKTDSDSAKVFHLETSANLSLRSSGIRLLQDLRVRTKASSTLSEHAAEMRFKSTIYFKGAMTLDQVKLGAATFKADFEARSEQYAKSHYLLMQALLDELPPALQPGQSNVVKEEKIKLERTHEKQKVGKAELPTWDEFLIDIAIMLKDVTGQKTKTAAPKEINNAEKNKGSYKGALTGKGKGGRTNTTPGNTGKGKGKGAGKGADKTLKCNVCNKTDVTTKACGCAPCNKCQLRYCTGAPGATKVTGLGCAQEMSAFPAYNDYVQAGGKLPGFLYEKARKKWHKKWNIPYEASAAEQDTEASSECDGGWTCEEIDASVCELEHEYGSDEYELSDEDDEEEDLEASMLEDLEMSTVTHDIFAAVTKGHPELLALREQMTIDETNTPRLNGYVTFLIDGGANTPIFQSPAILATAKMTGSKHKSISTAKGGDSLRLEGEATVTLYVKGSKGQHEKIEVKGHCASKARRNIIFEELFEKMGAANGLRRNACGERTWDITFESGAKWLVLMCNDLLFGFASLTEPLVDDEVNELEETEINEAEVPAIVWAARLATGADGIEATQLAVRNMKMPKLTKLNKHVIDHDQHRQEQIAKRKPMNAVRDPVDRSYEQGSVFIVDTFTFPGRDQVKQIAGRTGAQPPTAMFHAWDDAGSDFGYARAVATHNIDDTIEFLSHVKVTETNLGHTIKKIKMDRAPEVDNEELKRRVETELGIKLFIAPSGEHAGIHRAEAHMDPLSRATEAMLQRAKGNLPGDLRQYAALARKYAVWISDRRPPKKGAPSRLQKHCGRIPDFGDKNGMTPLVFGCKVVRLKDENERIGWKGVGNRAITGYFVGIEHTSYLVYNAVTRKVTKEPFVWAIDELELARGGLAAGAMLHDAEVQCEIITGAPLTLMPSTAPVKAPPKPPPKQADVPVGATVEVYWQGDKDSKELDGWYKGKVTSIQTLSDGQLRHTITYEGWSGEYPGHDLVNGKEWHRLDIATNGVRALGDVTNKDAVKKTALSDVTNKDAQTKEQPKAPPVTDKDGWTEVPKRKSALKAEAPPTRTTRHSKLTTVAEVALAALEFVTVDSEMTQSIIEVLMGDNAPPMQMGDAPETILARVVDTPFTGWTESFENPKAEASMLEYTTEKGARVKMYEIMSTAIEYTTDAGEKAIIDQPKGYKQVMMSVDRDKWIEAHRKAFEALKAVRGNQMIRRDEAEEAGPVFECVTTNVVKTDPGTNKLIKLSARHSLDGGPRGKEILRKKGIVSTTPTSSTTMDEVVMKMLLSHAAANKRFLTKADVTQAYTNATTSRGRRFLRCPTTCKEYDEDGTELVLELGPPLFGEPEAGHEWQMTLETDLRTFGWKQCENVGCLWRFQTADDDALLGTIVDDLLISCAKSYGIANKCIQYLKGKYIGVSFEHEPKSFAGYKITRSVDGTVINISMPELIEAKMKELCPELVGAKARKEFKALHAGGDKLQKLADGMVMEAPRADGKRTKHCMLVMSLTGCIRYFLRASAGELNVIAHRLSSIMARAPPEAVTVAQAAMIMAYEQRERGITYSAHDHHPKSEESKTSSLEVSFATGVPREPGIHAVADCSWGDRNLYGCIIMMNYGAIVCETKKMGPVNSSAEGEGITTSKCAELVIPVQEAARAMGIALEGPTIIRSDNAANVRVANDPNAAIRLKHALRRFATLQGRVAAGEVKNKIVHVPDKFNAADFLTKWVSAKKVKESVAYTSNEVAKPKGPSSTETNAFEVEMTAVTNLFGLEVSALELFEPETTHADPKYFAARLFTTDEVDVDPAPFTQRRNERDEIPLMSNVFMPSGIYSVYRSEPAAEIPVDFAAFARDRDALAQRLAESTNDPFCRFANGTIHLYLGRPKIDAPEDDAVEPRDEVSTGMHVRAAIAAIEVRDAANTASTSNRPKRPAAKDTDAPGWGGYEAMTEKDEKDVAADLAEARRELIESRKRFKRMYVDTGWGHEEVERDDGAGDIADAYMYYDEMVAERKARKDYDEMVAERKAQGREVEGRYRQHFQSNHEGLVPSDDECERYDPEDHDEQCDEYGDQSGDPEITFNACKEDG